jgi:hypothetical protein
MTATQTNPGHLTPRGVLGLLVWFALVYGVFLFGAYLLNESKKERIAYTKWCEERGYEYRSSRRGHYCYDRSMGKTIERPKKSGDGMEK